MMACAAGIGCFLAFIGLQKSEGLGIITFDPATLVTLGGCPPEEQVRSYFDWLCMDRWSSCPPSLSPVPQAHAYTMRDIDAYVSHLTDCSESCNSSNFPEQPFQNSISASKNLFFCSRSG